MLSEQFDNGSVVLVGALSPMLAGWNSNDDFQVEHAASLFDHPDCLGFDLLQSFDLCFEMAKFKKKKSPT